MRCRLVQHFGMGGVGLGIRFDIPEAEHCASPSGWFNDTLFNRACLIDEVPSARTPPPPSAQDQPTDQPDQAERTQPALPETSLMPPAANTHLARYNPCRITVPLADHANAIAAIAASDHTFAADARIH